MDALNRYTKLPLKELRNLFQLIQMHPGSTVSGLAKMRGWAWGKTARRLIALEAISLLVYEDDEGRFYPFEVNHDYRRTDRR